MADANRDQNFVPIALGQSSTSATTTLPFKIDSSTGRLLVDAASGSGTVTDVSVVTANGFAGSVATSTTTPAITLSTTINSPVLAGNGTAISAATTTGSGSTVVLATSATLVTPLVTTSIRPSSNDGATLGVVTTGEWSDLFLAEGAIINWDGGDVTLTQSGNTLSVAGGQLLVPDGSTAAPAYSFSSETNTGIVQASAGVMGFVVTGTQRIRIVTSGIEAQSSTGFKATNAAASATAPSLIPNRADTTTGIGAQATGNISLIIGGVENIRLASTILSPAANDLVALGSTSLAFSDLFLASGAVINIANDWIATHTAGILTVGTGDLRVTTAGTNSASAVTVGGTQTLTSKTLTSPTITTASLSGAQQLAENAAIQLDTAGSADGKYSGITIAGTAGATLAFGDLIYLDPTDSRWELADANAASGADGDSRGILGICVLAAASDGDPTLILLYGNVRADTAFPAMTINNPMYVSETAGDITGTQPTTTDVVIRIVGHALTADELLFTPDNTWITHT